MRLHSRLQRLEQRLGGRDDGCPACRDRRGRHVMVTSRRLPDGTTRREDGAPAPCEACGHVPEFVIEIVECLVETREDVDRLAAVSSPSGAG